MPPSAAAVQPTRDVRLLPPKKANRSVGLLGGKTMRAFVCMATACLVVSGSGASDSPNTGGAFVPATAAIIARVGEDFFTQYITPQSALWNPPQAECSEHPSACPDETQRGYTAVTYRFRIPDAPWVDEIIQCNVDADGRVSNVFGVPDCIKNRAACSFPYDDAAAEAIAVKAGLAPGIEAWKYHFHWHYGFHTYVWTVSNTLSRHRSDAEGRIITIDANDGHVLEFLYWSETS
jgi:hypothetical protein